MNRNVNRALIAVGVAYLIGFGYAQITVAQQQAAKPPQCPDYSLQLAQGVNAYAQRDALAGQVNQLLGDVAAAKKEAADAEQKVTADQEVIKTLRTQLNDATSGKVELK